MLEDAKDFEGVVPVLLNLLEPPEMSNINHSFNYLHEGKSSWSLAWWLASW